MTALELEAKKTSLIRQILDISDDKLLRKLERLLKKSREQEEEETISKEEILNGIREGLRDVKAWQEGKIELQDAREFLRELQD